MKTLGYKKTRVIGLFSPVQSGTGVGGRGRRATRRPNGPPLPHSSLWLHTSELDWLLRWGCVIRLLTIDYRYFSLTPKTLSVARRRQKEKEGARVDKEWGFETHDSSRQVSKLNSQIIPPGIQSSSTCTRWGISWCALISHYCLNSFRLEISFRESMVCDNAIRWSSPLGRIEEKWGRSHVPPVSHGGTSTSALIIINKVSC